MNWDYIVVGAGSAGCALVNELVHAGCTVLVIEAGGNDRSAFIKVAAGQSRACADHDWGYQSQPDPSRNGASEHWTRGRVLGGSSSINGTLFVRGTRRDYDDWGIPSWSADEVMPIFREYETSDQLGGARGRSGSLHVRTVKRPHSVTRAFIESACAVGHAFNHDYNGDTQEGVAYAQLSQRGGFRCSAADAFLKPNLRRKNLELLLHALVENIEIANGRAIAVSFLQNGQRHQESARDVIVCAGAINSPKLLMLSGIGDPEELQRHGIALVQPSPGVGRNLREHPLVSLIFRTRIPTYNLSEGLMQKIGIAAEFLRSGEGPISNLFEGTAFIRSSAAEPVPNLQLIFMACSAEKGPDGSYRLANIPAVMVHVIASYPRSSGRVRLLSRNPGHPPRIECRLLEEQADVDALVDGIGTTRAIFKADPLASLVAEEITPGAHVGSRAALQAFVRNNTSISFHPIGTCKMGLEQESAVVDANLRVHGIENLWVADASIIPRPLSANINAACMMIGAKLGKQLVARR
jgi:choline dehydrogenase